MTSMTGGSGYNDKIPKGYKQGQMQQFTPQQMQLFQQMFSQVGPQSYLSRLAGGDQSMFEEMEAPSHRQFQGILGQLGSRFSGMGMGARKSSGFNLAGTQAASDFAQDLASKRQELQRQAISDLMGLSNNLLSQRPYDRFLVEKQQKQKSGDFWSALGGAIPGAAVGFLTGGPAGAAVGGATGAYSGYTGGGSMPNGSYSRQEFGLS